VIDTFIKTPMRFADLEKLKITPAIDIIDEINRIKIEAEVPGMGPEDLKISITNGCLMISGEKTTSKQDKDKYYQSREIAYGAYQRVISLPDSVDIDKAKATFKKGMLWIEIAKKEAATRKHKEIKVEEAKSESKS